MAAWLERDNARVNRATSKGVNLRVERMVKLAKPTIRGMSRPRREMSLRFNTLLSRDYRICLRVTNLEISRLETPGNSLRNCDLETPESPATDLTLLPA